MYYAFLHQTLVLVPLRKSFFSGHASFSMYTMLYLVVSCCRLENSLSTCPPSIVRTLDKLDLSVSVLPSVPLHLARRPAAAPSHPVHPYHDVLLHWPVPGVRPQAPSHRRASGFHPGRPGGLLHSEWTALPNRSRRADGSNSKSLPMFVTQGFCFLFLSPFFFFLGFLRVRLVQDQRETFDSLPNPGEERPRSPGRHQGAQQPSHHGVVAAVTRSSAVQIATAVQTGS